MNFFVCSIVVKCHSFHIFFGTPEVLWWANWFSPFCWLSQCCIPSVASCTIYNQLSRTSNWVVVSIRLLHLILVISPKLPRIAACFLFHFFCICFPLMQHFPFHHINFAIQLLCEVSLDVCAAMAVVTEQARGISFASVIERKFWTPNLSSLQATNTMNKVLVASAWKVLITSPLAGALNGNFRMFMQEAQL